MKTENLKFIVLIQIGKLPMHYSQWLVVKHIVRMCMMFIVYVTCIDCKVIVRCLNVVVKNVAVPCPKSFARHLPIQMIAYAGLNGVVSEWMSHLSPPLGSKTCIELKPSLKINSLNFYGKALHGWGIFVYYRYHILFFLFSKPLSILGRGKPFLRVWIEPEKVQVDL